MSRSRWKGVIGSAGLALAALLMLLVLRRSDGGAHPFSRSPAAVRDLSSPAGPVVHAAPGPWADEPGASAASPSLDEPRSADPDARGDMEPLVPPVTHGGSRPADPDAKVDMEPLVPPVTYGGSRPADPDAKVDMEPLVPPVTYGGSRAAGQ